MGHHHGHPLTGAMELRPDHWSATPKISPRDPKELRTDTDQEYPNSQLTFLIQHIYKVSTFIANSFCVLDQTHSNSSKSILIYSYINSPHHRAIFITNHSIFITCQESFKFTTHNSYTLSHMHNPFPHTIIK